MPSFEFLSKTLKVNDNVATLIGSSFIVLCVGVFFLSYLRDVNVNLLAFCLYIVAIAICVAAIAAMPDVLKALVSWVITTVFLVWLLVLCAQIVTTNGFAYLAPAQCLIQFWHQQCHQVNFDKQQAASGIQTTNQVEASSQVGTVTNKSDARVYIQFAGFPRKVPVSVASVLTDKGWSVIDAKRGGERHSAAAGLNEVRFFKKSDENRAVVLAKELSAALPNNPSIEVKDFSSTSHSERVKSGHLEIWMSLL